MFFSVLKEDSNYKNGRESGDVVCVSCGGFDVRQVCKWAQAND
jgi:hypothetical protein